MVSTTAANSFDHHMKGWTLKGSNTEDNTKDGTGKWTNKEWETINTVEDFIFPSFNYADMKFQIAEPKSYK